MTRRQQPSPPRASAQAGFTLVEILVSLVVLMIGVTGILTMQMSSMKGTSYSRHATEAIVLAEDKLEELLSVDPASAPFANGSDPIGGIDAQGNNPPVSGVAYTRNWAIAGNPLATITLTITWQERGRDNHTLTFRTQRQRQ